MTDRAVKDKNISNSSSKQNNNEVVAQKNSSSHHSHQLHHQSSSNHHHLPPKDVASKSHEDFTNDTFIKRYKVIEKIGEGSYSEVLKCQNRHEGTVVACKRLKHIYKNMDDVINISEVATLRTIQKHSNILQMIEIHYDKSLGKVSLVFELMDINLYELIKDRKRLLPESRVRAIMFQLFRALRHLHKLGVFHRDIKPENILIKTKTDQLKLGDLGSVRGMFSRPPYTEYISTRWYRSPECLLTAGHYSHKMDIWAAGCVFYEVLTLRPLFPGSSEIDQINRINTILGPPPMKLLDTFQKQAEMERETYRGQSQLARRQQIQKVLNSYSSRYMSYNDSGSKTNSTIKHYRRNNMEFHFAGKEGTGLEKILPAHISCEAKDIIKSCLLYDPEQRPTAQRIVQLGYFTELRESYAKNPEKVSSKSVVLICDDTVTDQCTPIELGTLGDHKVRYRRAPKEQQKIVVKSQSPPKAERKPSSIKSTDINNNPYSITSTKRGTSSNSTENMAVTVVAATLTGSQTTAGSKSKVNQDRGKLQQKDSREARKSSSLLNKTSASNRGSRLSNNATSGGGPQTSDRQLRVSSSKMRGSNQDNQRSKNSLGSSHHRRMAPGVVSSDKKKQKQQSTSSTTSFESVQTPVIKDRKSYNQSNKQSVDKTIAKEPKSNILTLTDISLSPYVKAPSELKFLQKKIKNDQNSRVKNIPPLIVQSIQQPVTGQGQVAPSSLPPQQQQNIDQSSSHPAPPPVRVSVVPPKVAAAAIKYVKVNNTRSKSVRSSVADNETTEQTESSGTNIGGQGLSQTDDNLSYNTESSVKVGKLRFRQTSNQQQQQGPPQQKETQLQQQRSIDNHNNQRSKIPVPIDERIGALLSSRRNSKLINSPPEQRRETGTTEKWRNTGIPRMIPMSPERERNIKLLKESLTLDKHKRVQIRYQQNKQLADQDLLNNNKVSQSVDPIQSKNDSKTGVGSHHDARLSRKGAPSAGLVPTKNNYDYTSQDTLRSTPGDQARGTYSSTPGGGGGGRYRHSTTDYENPDAQETSSASAAALENQQRQHFNATMRKGRLNVPPHDSSGLKKAGGGGTGVTVKKSIEMYPPEMLDLYSSRYRGPDVNMNILKDSSGASNYVKRGSNSENRGSDVKEKLNYKFEQRRQQQNRSSQQVGGEQSSKVVSERASYGNYSTSMLGAGEEERFSRAGMRMERRPPIPPVGGGGGGGGGGGRAYKDVSPEGGGGGQVTGQYSQHGRRASMIPTTTTVQGQAQDKGRLARSLSNATAREQVRKDLKEGEKKKGQLDRVRGTMRDDVFCSSDDDVVISMRKKFDSLISERARKLSESLKTNQFSSEAVQKNPQRRSKARESNSDEDLMMDLSRRSRNRDGNSDKSRKYARRELRARMAESLTGAGEKWAGTDHIGQGLLMGGKGESVGNSNNNIGDWLLPSSTKYTDKGGGNRGAIDNLTSYNPSSVLRARKTNVENEFQDSLKYHHQHSHQASRIHPFPIQEQTAYRRGQIFTPPSNKPVYQSAQLGNIFPDRKLRYSHNTPMPVAYGGVGGGGGGGGNRVRSLKDVELKKPRQRV